MQGSGTPSPPELGGSEDGDDLNRPKCEYRRLGRRLLTVPPTAYTRSTHTRSRTHRHSQSYQCCIGAWAASETDSSSARPRVRSNESASRCLSRSLFQCGVWDYARGSNAGGCAASVSLMSRPPSPSRLSGLVRLCAAGHTGRADCSCDHTDSGKTCQPSPGNCSRACADDNRRTHALCMGSREPQCPASEPM